jgi:hypothetical protein
MLAVITNLTIARIEGWNNQKGSLQIDIVQEILIHMMECVQSCVFGI